MASERFSPHAHSQRTELLAQRLRACQSHITRQVVDTWRQHQNGYTKDITGHLTERFPVLGCVNARYTGSLHFHDWLLQQLRGGGRLDFEMVKRLKQEVSPELFEGFLDGLEELKNSDDTDLSQWAESEIRIVGGRWPAGTVQALRSALKQTDNKWLRRQAARALASSREQLPYDILPQLMATLRQKDDAGLRQQSASALASFGIWLPQELLQELLDALKQKEDSGLRYAVIEVLRGRDVIRQDDRRELPEDIQRALLDALSQKEDIKLRQRSAEALASLGWNWQMCGEIVLALLDAVKYPENPELRNRAVDELKSTGSVLSKLSLQTLIDGLKSRKRVDWAFTRDADRALSLLEEMLPGDRIAMLREAFNTVRSTLRSDAAEALCMVQPAFPAEEMRELMEALRQDDDIELSYSAVPILESLGRNLPDETLDALHAALKQTADGELRRRAVRVLEAVNRKLPKDILQTLCDAFIQTDDWRLQRRILRVLNSAGAAVPTEGLRGLMNSLQYPDDRDRNVWAEEALKSVARQLPVEILQDLVELLRPAYSPTLRFYAARVLEAVGKELPGDILRELTALLKRKDTGKNSRDRVVRVLKAVGTALPGDIVRELTETLIQTADSGLRDSIAEVLNAVGSEQPVEIVQELLEAFRQTDDGELRGFAAGLLASSGSELPMDILEDLAEALKQTVDLRPPYYSFIPAPGYGPVMRSNNFTPQETRLLDAAVRALVASRERLSAAILRNLMATLKQTVYKDLRRHAVKVLSAVAGGLPREIVMELGEALHHYEFRFDSLAVLKSVGEALPKDVVLELNAAFLQTHSPDLYLQIVPVLEPVVKGLPDKILQTLHDAYQQAGDWELRDNVSNTLCAYHEEGGRLFPRGEAWTGLMTRDLEEGLRPVPITGQLDLPFYGY